MRYVLRADASQSIGAGHVMRSSAIAEELIARGETAIFVGRISCLPWVEEKIASLGFSHIYKDPSDFISNPESDVLLLDSYEINIADAFIAFEKWHHIVAIVDGLTPNYRCTLRIHPGLDSNWVGDSDIPILAGPKYIPFRTSLSKNIHIPSQEQQKLKIAVVAGGSDPYGLVHEIAKILVALPDTFEVYLFTNFSADLVSDSRFSHVEIGTQLELVIRNVDLVFTTSSTSSLEFIACGLPVGVAWAVDNQEQYYASLGHLGIAAQLGSFTLQKGWSLNIGKICELIRLPELRAGLVEKARGLIDFNGASRIADAIKALNSDLI